MNFNIKTQGDLILIAVNKNDYDVSIKNGKLQLTEKAITKENKVIKEISEEYGSMDNFWDDVMNR